MIKVIGITKENKSILMSYVWAHTFAEVKQNPERVSEYEYQLYDDPNEILRENNLEPTCNIYKIKKIFGILLPDAKYYDIKQLVEVKQNG